jgi:hypothetical protein
VRASKYRRVQEDNRYAQETDRWSLDSQLLFTIPVDLSVTCNDVDVSQAARYNRHTTSHSSRPFSGRPHASLSPTYAAREESVARAYAARLTGQLEQSAHTAQPTRVNLSVLPSANEQRRLVDLLTNIDAAIPHRNKHCRIHRGRSCRSYDDERDAAIAEQWSGERAEEEEKQEDRMRAVRTTWLHMVAVTDQRDDDPL